MPDNLIEEVEAAAQRARDDFENQDGRNHSWDDVACEDFQSTAWWPRIKAELINGVKQQNAYLFNWKQCEKGYNEVCKRLEQMQSYVHPSIVSDKDKEIELLKEEIKRLNNIIENLELHLDCLNEISDP